MNIYLAGKITGLDPLICQDMFRIAERAVEGRGHRALNPLTMVDQSEGRSYEEYLLDALRIMMLDADAVLMLPNWRDSRGARIEHFAARELGMPVFYRVSFIPENAEAKAA